MPDAKAWPHERVQSVRGPQWCCRECSLSAKQYVEWPCPGTQLLTFALLGATTDGRSSS